MRSRPGSAPTSSRERAAPAAAPSRDRRAPGPHVASSSAALSRTDRVSACSTAPAADDVAVLGPERVARPGRLEAEQPARRRRVAQRAAEVVAVRHRHHARTRPRPPTRRSTRWWSGCGSHGLRVGPNSTGSHAGAIPNSGVLVLPRTTRPGPAQAHDELLVEGGHVAAPGTREPSVNAHALHLAGEVLEQVRHPGERAAGRGARRVERPVEDRRDDRVQVGVQRLDPLDRRLDQLGRR